MLRDGRSLFPVAVGYGSLGLVALAIALSGGFELASLSGLGLWACGIVAADIWSYRFSDKVHWSYGSAVVAAPLVLSSPGSAAVVASVLGMLGAITDTEFAKLRPARLIANAGQLTVAGFAAGITFEVLRPEASGPSLPLLFAVGAAFGANLIINTAACRSRRNLCVWPIRSSWPIGRFLAARL